MELGPCVAYKLSFEYLTRYNYLFNLKLRTIVFFYPSLLILWSEDSVIWIFY